MRKIIYCCFMVFCAFLGGCSTQKMKKSPSKMDIYILMGQSNMSGRGPLTEENKAISNPRVMVFTQDMKWVIAHNPLHFDKPSVAAVGPGLSFGIAMEEANPNVKIGLVPTAVGGTSINVWVPGGKDTHTGKYPYDDAVKRIKEAMKHGTVKGILWHQGESDSRPDAAAKYLPKLKTLIERVRKVVGNEELPFVAGELGRYQEQYQNINQELKELPSMVPNTAVVSSEGLTDKGDHTHFDASSAMKLGERYAVKMMQLQKKNGND